MLSLVAPPARAGIDQRIIVSYRRVAYSAVYRIITSVAGGVNTAPSGHCTSGSRAAPRSAIISSRTSRTE